MTWREHGIHFIDLDITDQCNFACKYCYHSDGCNRGQALDQVVKDKLTTILKAEQPQVTFFGGEPLLCKPQIKEIIAATGCRWSATSNISLLAKEDVAWFRQTRGGIHVSIDGNSLAHNANRIQRGGGPTFSMVKSKVPLALRITPGDTARFTVTPDTVPHLANGVMTLHQLGFKAVAPALVEEAEWLPRHWDIYREQVQQLAEYQLRWPLFNIKIFSDCLRKHPDPKRKCGAGFNTFAVSTTGKLFPCHRFTHATDDTWCLGTVDHVDTDKVKMYRQEFTATNTECDACPCNQTCNRGCPNVSYLLYSRVNSVVPVHCQYMKIALPIALALIKKLPGKNAYRC